MLVTANRQQADSALELYQAFLTSASKTKTRTWISELLAAADLLQLDSEMKRRRGNEVRTFGRWLLRSWFPMEHWFHGFAGSTSIYQYETKSFAGGVGSLLFRAFFPVAGQTHGPPHLVPSLHLSRPQHLQNIRNAFLDNRSLHHFRSILPHILSFDFHAPESKLVAS
jgi:hypothetical protein